MVLALAVEVNAESQILRGLEEMDFLFEQQRIAAQVDVLLASNQAFNDFRDLRMQQWLAAGDRHHGRAALVHGLEALFRRELALKDVRGILNLAASGAGQVAAEQRLKHQDERVLLASGKFLPDNIAGHRPHLRNRNTHSKNYLRNMLSGQALAISS